MTCDELDLKTVIPTQFPDLLSVEMKFSQALVEDSPFHARDFVAGKDAMTLARDSLALDHEQFNAAFRKSPMKRAKLAGLHRNAAVVLDNVRDH